MSQVSVARPRGVQTSVLYMGVWVTLSVVSLAYIGVALLKPDLLADARLPGMTDGRASGPIPSQSQGALLERGLAEVRGQLTDIQLKVMRGELREQELATRLAAIETRLEEMAARPSAAMVPAAPVTSPPEVRAEKAAEKTERTRTAAAPPPPRTQPTSPVTTQATRPADPEVAETEPTARPNAKAQKAAPLETASIARQVQPFGAPEVRVERTDKADAQPAATTAKASDDAVGIQLGGAPSLDSLRLNWTILSDRHGEQLSGLQPRYVTSDALGTTSFNLVAGPVQNRAEAIRICAKLRNQGVSCRLTAFQGSQL